MWRHAGAVKSIKMNQLSIFAETINREYVLSVLCIMLSMTSYLLMRMQLRKWRQICNNCLILSMTNMKNIAICNVACRRARLTSRNSKSRNSQRSAKLLQKCEKLWNIESSGSRNSMKLKSKINWTLWTKKHKRSGMSSARLTWFITRSFHCRPISSASTIPLSWALVPGSIFLKSPTRCCIASLYWRIRWRTSKRFWNKALKLCPSLRWILSR
mgnify:CR=1 FL=1